MSDIKIKRIKVLSGPNIWAYRPVLEILADIGKYEELPSTKLPGFTERLVDAIPTLWEHRCSEGRPGGFLERLRLGTYMGHIIEHIILELESLAGMDVGFGRTRGTEHHGEYRIVVDYKDEEAGKMCVGLAVELVGKLAEGQPLDFDLSERISEVREVTEDNVLGPSTQSIVDAAKKRGIPWMRLSQGSLVQLGHGRLARRIQASETSNTSNIAVEIASDKELTKELLNKVGVPVPRGVVVTDADAAWEAAQDLDGPVVLKPYDGNQGKAVSVNLSTEEQVRTAFALAQEFSHRVIVERFLNGPDFRLLVVGGKLVAAAERCPAQVVADGRHNIRDLVQMVNEDPRRGHGHGAALTRIKMDAAAELTLAKQELTWESEPSPGQVVLLRDNSNLSTGGTATDVTDDVHPDNAAIAVLTARTVGLDIAGIDVVCESIKRPLDEQGGGIVEVNAAPGLRMHVYPSEGKSRPVGEAIIEMLFPRDDRRPTTDDRRPNAEQQSNPQSAFVLRPRNPQFHQARVPLIAVTGTNGKTTVTRMIGHIYSTMKLYVGMTTTDGIYFGGIRRVKGDCAGPRSAEAVLQHPLVEVAVLETARGGILRSGLAFDKATVGAVLNVASDHLGLEGIETPERLARVKRVVIESVAADGYGVLNADDPLTVAMAEYCPGQVIYFGMDRSARPLALHLAGGGKAAFFRNGDLVLAQGSEETVLVRAADIPATYNGLIPFQIQNSLAAAAACWGAGVALESISLGLRTFQTDEKSAPGRFNVFTFGQASVIVDYGHNPHALKAIQSALQQMKSRRKIGVVSAPGDRRDADIQELAVVAANTFDLIIVREDDDLRGREQGEVASLIAETIKRTKPSLPISVILDEMESVSEALQMARAGDTVVLFIDSVDKVIEQVKMAAQAVSIEESDAFWCPVPDPSPSSQRARAEAIAELATQGVQTVASTMERPIESNGSKSSSGSATSPQGNGLKNSQPITHKSAVTDLMLHDGEPDGHS
jgi:cyanophycin synthetase